MTNRVRHDFNQTGCAMRQALRKHFPGVKISVQRERGYGYFNVQWVDGPTASQVQEVLAPYRASRVNSRGSVASHLDVKTHPGEIHCWAGDPPLLVRSYSPEARAWAAKTVGVADDGQPYPEELIGSGSVYCLVMPGGDNRQALTCWLREVDLVDVDVTETA